MMCTAADFVRSRAEMTRASAELTGTRANLTCTRANVIVPKRIRTQLPFCRITEALEIRNAGENATPLWSESVRSAWRVQGLLNANAANLGESNPVA